MSDANADKRVSGRREKTRRAYDLLDGYATEEERQAFDTVLCRELFLIHNRRKQIRRSGKDRRDQQDTTMTSPSFLYQGKS